jgi:hypothetical protein
MNKRRLHHFWRKFRLIKPWYFFAIALVFGVLCVGGLRSNYQHMVSLRNDVYQADKDNGNTTQALTNLRAYVNAHMNTNLVSGADAVYPPIQLKYTYDRLVSAASNQATQINSQVYTQAQQYCEQLYPGSFSGGPRVPCITAYVNSHGAQQQPIPDDLYKFSFASPVWSPDLAGWSMVVAILAASLGVILFVTRRWFKTNIA